ncbi:NAD(P)/FAD-dependent oxidoreductase [Acidihalobacter prosperus]|uniref:Pyridine nucleotide-disulfide oxidoreductase n=1 Tax=Acidihalobacter prosperus TaxID=160660 RepID=A0A1A6C4K6_9GAMM|nr:FAD/NAD(P)-binding oxidoreductase [Acidihalobacter prosperus]OBS09496.1 pyridine nucleotide-disulfide oxidoreductase [Acidihalobacter prosperus]
MKILIVGGGMGGTILANNLARRLKHELKQGKAQITMLSASERHMYQPGLLYVSIGRMATDALYREQTSLLEPEIEFHVDPVTTFTLDQNQVTTQSGKTYGYDMLVIATGSRAMPETIPGLAENSVNCYTEANAVEMWRQVREFQGGTVTIAVGVPHKCPMIPLEVTFVLHDYFKERGILDKVKFQYTYPIGRIHSLAPVGEWAKGEFDRLGIQYETLFNMKEVDGANKVVHSEEGTQSHYDLLVAVPPHKGMAVIEENGLGQSGWIPTDRHSLKMEGRDNVYVLGDTTNLPISKAGSTAHFEAEALAENLAAIVKLGEPVRDYDGKVFCFIEAGSDRATYAMFNYNQPPAPRAPNRAVHWFKMAYNQLYWASARGLL